MTTVALLVHGGREDALDLGAALWRWLAERGHEVVLPEDEARRLPAVGHPHLPDVPDQDHRLDLVVAIGGDGTVLRAARRAVAGDAAVLGINLGQLGYLAEVEPGAWEEALQGFLAGTHRIDERLMVASQVRGQDLAPALNEVVIEKQALGRTVRLGVRIDGEYFTSYVADGLILASPTGSTAYSLSARGPIVAPSHRALLLTPVSPHTLFDRSLVLGPDSVVEVEVLGDRDAEVSVDGQVGATVAVGETVTVRAAPRPARFVTFGGRDFHQILKAKFGLSDR